MAFMGPQPHLPVSRLSRETKAGVHHLLGKACPSRLWLQQEKAQLGCCAVVLPRINAKDAAQTPRRIVGDPSPLSLGIASAEEIRRDCADETREFLIKALFSSIERAMAFHQPIEIIGGKQA